MIRELHTRLVERTLSARSLAEKYLAAIAQKEKKIGAYLTLFEKEVLEEADRVDEQIGRGEKIDLLAGIPGAIKDNICIEGQRTTAGSKMLDNYLAPSDATVIKRLRKCGGLILGKTNMDEFAMGSSTENSAYQRTTNPYDEERVPGGSSGGSAAAVAAEEAVWALGSDTGGSIRQPASFCGLVGLKPTYGRVSRSGLIAMASGLDQIGPMTKTVEDAAIVFSRTTGFDPLDATTAQLPEGKPFEELLDEKREGLTIGVPAEYWPESLDSRVRQNAERALERFQALGMKIESVSLPHTSLALPVYYILVPSEISSNLARFDGIRYGFSANDQKKTTLTRSASALLETYLDSRRHGLGAEVKRRIMLGTYALSAGYYDAYYKKATQVRARMREDFEKVFQKVDLLFSPTTPTPAFRLGEKNQNPLEMYLSDIFTVPANLAGIPALSFPIGSVDEGGKNLPIGGQLMGKWFDEEALLSAAAAFEKNQ